MKKKNLTKVTMLSMMPLILSTSLIINNATFSHNSNLTQTIQAQRENETLGFDLRNDLIEVNDSEIIQGGFKGINYFPEESIDERNIPRTPHDSKYHIKTEHFTVSFGQTDIGGLRWGTMIVASLHTEANRGLQRIRLYEEGFISAVSAHYVSNYLWLIVEIDTGEYFLDTYIVENPESGMPIITHKDNFNLGTFAAGITPAIVPIHYLNADGQMSVRNDEILVMSQGETFTNSFGQGKNAVKRYRKPGRDEYPVPKDNIIGQLSGSGNNSTSKLISMFVLDQAQAGAPEPNYLMNIYHTTNSDLKLSHFDDKFHKSTIYNEAFIPLASSTNQSMPYPKIVENGQNYELLWVFMQTGSNNVNEASRIFSTSLNSNFEPLPVESQAKVANLFEIKTSTGELVFIDYYENGSFEDGSIYVPLKFVKNNNGTYIPGVLNWKDTNNESYWTHINSKQSIDSIVSIPEIQIEGFALPDQGQALNSAFLEKVELNEFGKPELTFLMNNIAHEYPEAFFRQVYTIEQDPTTNENSILLNYHTHTPSEIISNANYVEGNVTQQEIINEIKNFSTDFLRSNVNGEFSNQIEAVPNSLQFSVEDGINTATIDITYPLGTYTNGVLSKPATPVQKTVKLIQQPVNQFLPLQIETKQQPDPDFKGSLLVETIEAAIAPNTFITPTILNDLKTKNILGSLDSQAEIKMTNIYLERLIGLTASADDFNGNIEFGFTFIGNNEAIQQRSLTLTGFHSGRIEQENAEAEADKLAAEAAANAAESLTILVSSLVSGIAVFAIVLISVIFYLQNKKKQAMFASLQAGMNLSQKMSSSTKVADKQLDKVIGPKKGATTKPIMPDNKKASVELPKKPVMPKK